MTLYQSIKQEGIEKGEWQKNIKVIITGYKNGASIDFLAKITGLDVKQVEEIISTHLDN